MNKNFKLKNYPAYTLIEVLIAVSIFVMVVGMVVAIFMTNSRIQAKTQSVRETSQTLRYIIEAIGREVQLADGCNLNDADLSKHLYPIYTDPNLLTIYRTDKIKNYCIKHDYLFSDYKITVNVETKNLSDESTVTENFDLNSNLNNAITEMAILPTDYNQAAYENLTQQPSIQIILKGKYIGGSKTTEGSEQTLRTAFTTRNYPGFNDISQ